MTARMADNRLVDQIDSSAAAEFVARFADAWRTADLDKHEALWREDIVLVQPLLPNVRGKAGCRAAFARLFALVPDLHAVVHRWGASDDAIFVEFTLRGTFGAREQSWDPIDRFTLVDGLIAERVSYFDATPLALTIARRPTGWGRLLRVWTSKRSNYFHPSARG
jgi:limonene-1,2-epoxide hydrolase